MRIRFFRLSKNKTFDYKPMYYNEEKEELQQRIERAKREAGKSDDGTYVPNIKGQFKPVFDREMRRSSQRQSNLRLMVIIAVLFGIAYWLLGDFKELLF